MSVTAGDGTMVGVTVAGTVVGMGRVRVACGVGVGSRVTLWQAVRKKSPIRGILQL